MKVGPGKISRAFNAEFVDEPDAMIRTINAMKSFLKKREAANLGGLA